MAVQSIFTASNWDTGKLEQHFHPNDYTVLDSYPMPWRGRSRRGALAAVCDDQRRGQKHSTGDANADQVATATLFRIYYDPYSSDDDVHPRQMLLDAFEQALGAARYDDAHWQRVVNAGAAPGPADSEEQTGSPAGPAGLSENKVTMIAAVVHHDMLYVAYNGQNRAYLWHGGQLEHLTTGPLSASGIGYVERRLSPSDRVLLCTQGLYRNVNSAQLAHVLRNQARSRRAVAALLNIAAKTQPVSTVSAAVLNYESQLSGVVAPLVLGALMIAAVALLVWTLLGGGPVLLSGDTFQQLLPQPVAGVQPADATATSQASSALLGTDTTSSVGAVTTSTATLTP